MEQPTMMRTKAVSELAVSDLRTYPVWEYVVGESEGGEDYTVRPVMDLPVGSLVGRLVGTQVRLANGTWSWAVLSNISLANSRQTQHFLTLWVERRGRWFELARYFDVDYDRRGPAALASFLGLPVTAVFPISYDISDVAVGSPSTVTGIVAAEPTERLSKEELIALSLLQDT